MAVKICADGVTAKLATAFSGEMPGAGFCLLRHPLLTGL